MVAQIDFLVDEDNLRHVDDHVRAMVCLEVVRHPAGGWSHALPIDASQSTVRIYNGWWSSRRAAVQALGGLAG